MKRQRKKASFLSSGRKKTSAKSRSAHFDIDASEHTQRIKTSSSKSRSSNKGKKKSKKKSRPFLKKLRTFVLMAFFVGVVVISGILIGMYAAISREIKDMDFHNLSLTYSSFVYCTDELGNSYELEQLYDDGYRIWIEPQEIPDVMKNAVVAIEDERFYQHDGVDLKRTFGAFVNWTFEKLGGKKATYGGSTITQQVIKNITHEKERSSIRKIKEIMRAAALEKELSKDEIITLYLNIVFFANNCYGVEAASQMYFDKTTMELNLEEAALIAGITQRPSYFDPIRNPENALEKRNVVLAKMKELEMISEEEYNNAVNAGLGLKGNHSEKRSKIYSYFVDQVINDVINDLQTQKGYSQTFASQQVFNGGLKIYTTMDYDIQKAMEDVFENTSNFPTSSAAQKAQSAMVVIDPGTGQIKGIVGGKGEKTDSRGLNRATQTLRQPGSSLKPLAVYAPGIDTKEFTAATVLLDAKLTIGDWSPKNSYSGFKGNLSLRKALEISSNTATVRGLQELGIDTSYNYAKNKFHLSSIDNQDKALSPLGLGGLTYGVSVKELAAAYGSFANGGKYIKPHTYTKVVDNKGRVLLENNPQPEKAVSEETAYITTSLLTSVVKGSSGTGRLARLDDMPVAGKTGTTNNDHDKWFVGYTPYYVGAVWYGFDTPASIRSAGVSTNVSAKIWKLVMEKVHSGLSEKEFSKPESLTRATICTRSGKLASNDCGYASTEYFVPGTVPSKHCGNSHSSGLAASPTPSGSASADPNVSPAPTGSEGTSPEATSSPEATPGNETPQTNPPAPTQENNTPPPRPTQNVTEEVYYIPE